MGAVMAEKYRLSSSVRRAGGMRSAVAVKLEMSENMMVASTRRPVREKLSGLSSIYFNTSGDTMVANMARMRRRARSSRT
ncbi:MAG: hypothetical protein BWZ02_02588 [Lentisphaerae bacterium ADurb.BinA184]|nr:MAG: hypothetical protein BWZ02_02588 [Lentisphaerae bacterium ADurb.BinA184]